MFDPAAVNVELEAKLAELRIIYEGHADDKRLNVESTTVDDVDVQIERFGKLIAAIEESISTNNELIDAGWPGLPPLEVENDVLADLDAQLASLTAARGTYTSNTARRISLEGGLPVSKSTTIVEGVNRF